MQSIVVRIFLGVLLTISFLHAQKPDASVLRNMLLDKDPEIRVKAAEGLGRVGGRQAIVILRQGLTDSNVIICEALSKNNNGLPPPNSSQPFSRFYAYFWVLIQ